MRCPECAEKVQSKAIKCRFCGAILPEKESPKILIGVCIAAVIGVLVIQSMTSEPEPAKPQLAKSVEQPSGPSPYAVERMALRNLKASMRDPDSIATRNLRVPTGKSYLCGEVNGKNGFGGMTGYQHFIAGAGSEMPVALQETMEPAEFQKAWAKLC